jgi:mRNA interferase MazF
MSLPALARGDVVLTRFPYTDLTGAAVRPALVISRGAIADDVVLAAISSVVRGATSSTDCLVETTHAEFPQSGPRVTSVIRLHKLATVERAVIVRRLGSLGRALQAEADRLLRIVVGL